MRRLIPFLLTTVVVLLSIGLFMTVQYRVPLREKLSELDLRGRLRTTPDATVEEV